MVTSVKEDVEKRKETPIYIANGDVSGYSYYGKQFSDYSKS